MLATRRPEAPPALLGLDNVPLSLPLAGVAPRVLAGFLDYVLVMMIALGLTFVVALVGALFRGATWLVPVLLILGYFVLEYGYFAGFEVAMDGQTPGKRALRLRVVDAGGGRASPRGILVRNCVRSLDLVIGVPLMALDASARRLGDRFAGTLVVHEAEPERALLVRRVPRGWQARDVAVVESYLRRRRHLAAPKAEELARRLLDAVRRDDPALLDGVDTTDADRALRAALDVEGA